MITSIRPIMATATHASAARANAGFFRQYRQFADNYYANPSAEAVTPASSTPAAPMTRALFSPTSAGVFHRLRIPRKAGAAAADKRRGDTVRGPALAAVEPPPMPGMGPGEARVDAIHEDSRNDNPLASDRTRRTRTPAMADQAGAPASRAASVSAQPAAAVNGLGAAQARAGRDRAIINLFIRPGGDIYRAYLGAYAA